VICAGCRKRLVTAFIVHVVVGFLPSRNGLFGEQVLISPKPTSGQPATYRPFPTRGRCAMSKIVARKAFEGRNLPFSIRFESMAATYGTSVRASNGARKAIREVFGEDLLESHRGIIEDADLILVNETETPCWPVRQENSIAQRVLWVRR